MVNSKSAQNPSGLSGLLLEEDCERPSCDDIKNVLKTSLDQLETKTNKKADSKNVQCPPGKGEIGTSSWKLLHSMVSRRIIAGIWHEIDRTNERTNERQYLIYFTIIFYCRRLR